MTPYVLQRVPPGRLLCYGGIVWSSLTLLYAACSSWGAFMALRFLLGLAESVIFPSLTMIVQSFYTKAEQPGRNASKSRLIVLCNKRVLIRQQSCLPTSRQSSTASLPTSSDASQSLLLSGDGSISTS